MNPFRYHAYLLRIWLERPAASTQEAVWRFSLEGVSGEPRQGFANLDALTTYLKDQIDQKDEAYHDTDPTQKRI